VDKRALRMKRILFFTHQNPQGYRIQQYFPYLEACDFQVELKTTREPWPALVKSIALSDIVYIQRLLLSPLKLLLLRASAKKIIYDFDDAVMYGTRNVSRTRMKRFEGMVRSADLIFCGNSFLLAEAKRFKEDHSFYVPTVVDTDAYPVKAHTEKVPFVVGWMGSASTLRYLLDIEELFLTLPLTGQVQFIVVADKAPPFKGDGIMFKRWNKLHENHLLLSFDVGIMPLKEDLWSEGKCGLKLVQYMATGLPSIARSVGVAKEMITDGVNGFLCNNFDEWKEGIEKLHKDTTLRRNMGKAAREIAEEKYSLKVWGPRIAEIIGTL
jgi:glycosyltransferase involved in cell wall biosynthesis